MKKKYWWTLLAGFFLLVLLILAIFPFLWMVFSSFKTASEYIAMPPTIFPETFSLDNYQAVLDIAPFGIYLLNSAIVSTVTMVCATATSIALAIVFAFTNFKHKNKIFWAIMLLMIVPDELYMITNFQTISTLGLMDTKLAICLPYMINVMFIYFLKVSFEKIPREIIDAALMDGANSWNFIFKILLPYTKQTILATGLIIFINAWNAFLWPFLVTNTVNNRVVTTGIVAFSQEGGLNPQYQMVGATLAVIPVIILYLIFSKKIFTSITFNLDEVVE